jgi:hypothetical protein
MAVEAVEVLEMLPTNVVNVEVNPLFTLINAQHTALMVGKEVHLTASVMVQEEVVTLLVYMAYLTD